MYRYTKLKEIQTPDDGPQNTIIQQGYLRTVYRILWQSGNSLPVFYLYLQYVYSAHCLLYEDLVLSTVRVRYS